MKKLLLLISICCFSCVSFSQNSATQKSNTKPMTQDTAKGKKQISPAGTVGKGRGKRKKPSYNSSVGIDHKSPEQTKIDSIKKEKAKTKK